MQRGATGPIPQLEPTSQGQSIQWSLRHSETEYSLVCETIKRSKNQTVRGLGALTPLASPRLELTWKIFLFHPEDGMERLNLLMELNIIHLIEPQF